MRRAYLRLREIGAHSFAQSESWVSADVLNPSRAFETSAAVPSLTLLASPPGWPGVGQSDKHSVDRNIPAEEAF